MSLPLLARSIQDLVLLYLLKEPMSESVSSRKIRRKTLYNREFGIRLRLRYSLGCTGL